MHKIETNNLLNVPGQIEGSEIKDSSSQCSQESYAHKKIKIQK